MPIRPTTVNTPATAAVFWKKLKRTKKKKCSVIVVQEERVMNGGNEMVKNSEWICAHLFPCEATPVVEVVLDVGIFDMNVVEQLV